MTKEIEKEKEKSSTFAGGGGKLGKATTTKKNKKKQALQPITPGLVLEAYKLSGKSYEACIK